ncbi:MAG TPA: hypothetical protein ENK50_12315 [Sedimenticola sp.]|nr:hypothetical protein [Sedimenticola sp.]
MIECSLRPSTLLRWLLLSGIILVLLHLIAVTIYFGDLFDWRETYSIHYWHISIFDLDEEESFGTWFSSFILLFSSLLLWLETIATPAASRWQRRGWGVLAMGFAYLSLDEVVGLHEYLNSLLKETPWTDVALPVVAVLGLIYIPFLLRLPGRQRWLFLLAGSIYVGGAVGVERYTDWYQEADLMNTLPYNLWNALEEGMEMGGVILFIYALLRQRFAPLGQPTVLRVGKELPDRPGEEGS